MGDVEKREAERPAAIQGSPPRRIADARGPNYGALAPRLLQPSILLLAVALEAGLTAACSRIMLISAYDEQVDRSGDVPLLVVPNTLSSMAGNA
jgi:hypothetical protein